MTEVSDATRQFAWMFLKLVCNLEGDFGRVVTQNAPVKEKKVGIGFDQLLCRRFAPVTNYAGVRRFVSTFPAIARTNKTLTR